VSGESEPNHRRPGREGRGVRAYRKVMSLFKEMKSLKRRLTVGWCDE
jgi:hypothetical protein